MEHICIEKTYKLHPELTCKRLSHKHNKIYCLLVGEQVINKTYKLRKNLAKHLDNKNNT